MREPSIVRYVTGESPEDDMCSVKSFKTVPHKMVEAV